MIILDDKCAGLEAIINEYINLKKTQYEGSLSDYDDAIVSIKINGEVFIISLDWACAGVFFENGGKDAINAAYKGLTVEFDSSTKYTITFKAGDIPTGANEKVAFIANIARIKYHLFSGPFLKIIDGTLKPDKPIEVAVRPSEYIWIIPKNDKSIVCGYSHAVSDRSDLPIAQVVYHEFNDVKRDAALNACPTVQSSAATETVPADILNNFPNVKKGNVDGYFLFAIQPRHYAGNNAQKVIGQLLVFRAYLNYHFKCTKAFTHYRMMTTCKEWVQVLNRAKPERAQAKGTRTITGKKIIEKK